MSKELYVGNIPFEATEDELVKLFSVAGTVSSIHFLKDPVSGLFKGCGYVRMRTEQETKEAIECLDGALFLNRLLTVSIARPQKPKPAAEPGNRKPRGDFRYSKERKR
jgi:RNA recognition motif-containing protein